jgi:hypothetical protein
VLFKLFFAKEHPTNKTLNTANKILMKKKIKVCMYVQSDQQESKSEQALQIIGHVVAKSYAHKR